MKILVLTTEPLPFPGLVATGAGLRAWGLAKGLESAGLAVEIAMPDDHLSAQPSALSPQPPASQNSIPGTQYSAPSTQHSALLTQHSALSTQHFFNRSRLGAFVRERAPDLIVMQHWGLMRELGPVDCPLAIDLAGPHLLERRFWGSRSPQSDRAEKIEALRRADFVTCSGRTQRLYFLPWLDLAGFDVTDPNLCPVIPFSADPAFPPEGERDRAAFIYGGMFLPWQDPARALDTLLDAIDAAGRGRLRFYGGPHPTVDVSGGRFDRLVERLSRHGAVEMSGLKPFDALVVEYCRSGVAIDVMERNAERELAFPTRTVVYLWCGLPVIHSGYTELAPWIEQYEAGWTVDPADTARLREIVRFILQNPESVAAKSRNARRLVAEQFAWDRTIGPLAEWCRAPRWRENKEAGALQEIARDRRVRELEEELAATRRELDTLRGKLIFRLTRQRRFWGPLLAPFVFLAIAPVGAILFVLLWLTRSRSRAGSSSTAR